MDIKKGQHVFLTLRDGKVYEGDVRAINKDIGRLTLENIIFHPDNLKIENYRRFDFDELINIRSFQEEINEASVSPTASSDSAEQGTTIAIKIPEEDYKAIVETQKSYRYIKAYDNNFHNALDILNNSEKIGFCMLDVSRGRTQRGSIIGISTADHIFLFDIEGLGDQVFDKGLRMILESETILKIVHDCRLLSACLLEKHLTDLKNVTDLETVDILLVQMHHSRIRKHSRSLNYLVEYYLGVPNACMKADDYRDEWRKRPLELKYQDMLAVYMSYYLPLQKEMENWREKYFRKKEKEMSELYNSFWKNGDELLISSIMNNYTPQKKIEELLFKDREPRGTKKKNEEKQDSQENS